MSRLLAHSLEGSVGEQPGGASLFSVEELSETEAEDLEPDVKTLVDIEESRMHGVGLPETRTRGYFLTVSFLRLRLLVRFLKLDVSICCWFCRPSSCFNRLFTLMLQPGTFSFEHSWFDLRP